MTRPAGAADKVYRAAPRGLVVRVRLTPRASRDEIAGLEQTAEGLALKARVRAVPSEGEANEAIERLLALWLGLPRRAVQLIQGGKSRLKSLAIDGEPQQLSDLLEHKLGKLDPIK